MGACEGQGKAGQERLRGKKEISACEGGDWKGESSWKQEIARANKESGKGREKFVEGADQGVRRRRLRVRESVE